MKKDLETKNENYSSLCVHIESVSTMFAHTARG